MHVNDKDIFKISMLDDEPDSLDIKLDEIKLHLLKEYGLKLCMVKYTEESKILDELDNTTDIAFIDKNLGDDSNGIGVVKKIRDKHPLMDVFVYSRAEINKNELMELTPYSSVEVAQKLGHIIDKLKTLIDKNLSKWDDIVFLRGAVISRIIDLERDINDLLMTAFPQDTKEKKKEFRDLFLENSYISLEAKKRILKKLEKSFADGRLQKLQKSRNLLAHCKRSESDPSVLVSMGKGSTFDRDKIKKIFADAESVSKDIRRLQEKYRDPA